MDDTVKRALALLRQGIAGTKEIELVIAYIKQLETKIDDLLDVTKINYEDTNNGDR